MCLESKAKEVREYWQHPFDPEYNWGTKVVTLEQAKPYEKAVVEANKILGSFHGSGITLCPSCKTVSNVILSFNQVQQLERLRVALIVPQSEKEAKTP